MTNFTPEDLLLYLYKETDTNRTKAIEAALENDWTLREKMSVLKASMQRLDKLTESPRTAVVLNVLNYAREQAAQEVQ
jgi:ubiquitin C-terminal hydrolase